MQSLRSATTDRLADIIHIIRMGERSGVLTAERGEGQTREEGFIAFNNGQVVEAKTNGQSGPSAFNYLNSWQTCRFSFTTQATHRPSAPLQVTQPMAPLHNYAVNKASTDNLPHPDWMIRTTGRLPENSSMPAGTPLNFPSRLPAGEETLQRPDLSARLPRVSRRLLLLVNGQRSKSELARLMARSHDELQQLLDELERSGLIRQ
ncbi:MAG TPA: DUF4388 domain-containing protein [Ktedonobacteraceae bacterium]|nr:DUF4388 domain-containing protein [Ktedonobacteraceae bacterium]